MKKALLLLAALLVWPGVAAAETLRLAPRASARVELSENPSTGYSWRIDSGSSAGLDHVEIIDGGHQRGASMPGAPGKRLWTIRALAPGRAEIAFVYQRPWEPAPVETRRVEVEIGAAARQRR